MFEDWKQAWRDAVANFQRELEDEPGDETTRAMRRDERTAADALRRLDAELKAARKNAARERDEETVARRREGLAENAGDTETARIAAQFAARHAERALVLERKTNVLEAERALLVGDIERMRNVLTERGAEPRVQAGPAANAAPGPDPQEREREEQRFRRMEREAREREAEARLEELKRRMR